MVKADGMYGAFGRMQECYELLQDELSRKIFQARLACDFELSQQNLKKLVRLGEQQEWLEKLEEKAAGIAREAESSNRKLILYGTNVTGETIAACLMEKHIDFYGFCGRRAKEFTDGLMGKPVISPDFLFQHSEDYCVVVAVAEAAEEIMGILEENNFPKEQILSAFRSESETDHQYFEFPALFPRGKAFVDGGCLDCRTSYLFANWCEGDYSKIFAFEPDPISCSICQRNIEEKPIRDFQLIGAGLSDRDGETRFRTGLYGGSYVIQEDEGESEDVAVVRITTIDETVGSEAVGFIKMDIEGSEFKALHGAENTIVRDRPLLALSVYHVPGDMLAIMDYLHRLVPEYRFWLRHYSVGNADTVLYASAGCNANTE